MSRKPRCIALLALVLSSGSRQMTQASRLGDTSFSSHQPKLFHSDHSNEIDAREAKLLADVTLPNSVDKVVECLHSLPTKTDDYGPASIWIGITSCERPNLQNNSVSVTFTDLASSDIPGESDERVELRYDGAPDGKVRLVFSSKIDTPWSTTRIISLEEIAANQGQKRLLEFERAVVQFSEEIGPK